MMSPPRGPGRTPVALLFLYHAVAYAALLAVAGWLMVTVADDPGRLWGIVLAGAGAVGVVVMAILTWRIAAPVNRLAERVADCARGQPSMEALRLPVREVDDLARAIAGLTEEQRARLAAIERVGASMEQVLGALQQGTVLISPEDEVLYANPAAHQLLGEVPATLSGLAPLPFQAAVRECRAEGAPVTRTTEHGRPARILMGMAVPFIDEDQALLVVADVTDQQRAAEVRRDFVANASHELKTPVSAIIASADALRLAMERDGPEAARFAEIIERSARQLDRLVADLLDLSRLERDQPELSPVRLDLLLAEEVDRFRPASEAKGVTLEVRAAPVTVAGNRRDLATAVANLVDNAIRHTSEGGSIVATVDRAEAQAVLAIQDTGEGIPTKDLHRVFERFYRVDAARSRDTGGTGLGLAIVKHAAESHGGQVTVESELGVGSTFTVVLPLHQPGSPKAPEEA